MKEKRWILIAGLVTLLLGAGILVITLMNRPMGQTLTLKHPCPGYRAHSSSAATQVLTQVDILPTQAEITPTVDGSDTIRHSDRDQPYD